MVVSHEDDIGGPVAVGGSFVCGVNTSVLLPFTAIVALTEMGGHDGHLCVFGSGVEHGGHELTLNDSDPHAHIAPCVSLAFLLNGAQLNAMLQFRLLHMPVVASCVPRQ